LTTFGPLFEPMQTRLFLALLFLFLLRISGFGQVSTASPQPPSELQKPAKTDTVNQTDLIGIARKVFRIKKTPQPDSIMKKPGTLYTSVLPGMGYSIITGVTEVVTANLSFYADSGKKANISVVNIGEEYTQFNQFIPSIISSIWTKGNKVNFQGDWRYYKYSTYTYGLGGDTKTSESDLVYYNYLRVYELAMKEIVPDLMGGIGYNLDYHWGINSTQPNTGGGEDMLKYKYGTSGSSSSSGLSLNLVYDTRRNSNNPPSGYYANAVFRSNFTFLGSDQNYQSLLLELRKYVTLPAHTDNVLAFWSYAWFTLNGHTPYFDLPSTGWDTYANSGRAYIQGRYRGANMLYLEAEYRFGLSRNGLFGGEIFANAESLSNYPGNAFTSIAPAVGPGIRIKVNKYSNINLVIAYGFGIDGSRGFFFNLGEVF
jgi:hypothetical protein